MSADDIGPDTFETMRKAITTERKLRRQAERRATLYEERAKKAETTLGTLIRSLGDLGAWHADITGYIDRGRHAASDRLTTTTKDTDND